MGISVLKGGALTTVQDRGRVGYQDLGFSEAGVMDRRAFRLANLLLGNAENEAVLEVTMIGPEFVFQSDNCFVVTGADLGAKLNLLPIEVNRVYAAKAGDVVRFPKTFPAPGTGLRAYIAFAGGLDVPMLMGSRSTYCRGKMGGIEGRGLKTGDVIEFLDPKPVLKNLEQRARKESFEEVYGGKEITVRVILGPQDDCFTEAGIDTFLKEEYRITDKSDRMGSRLDGPIIEHAKAPDIVSDGIAYGAVQVPKEGKPIIMMADRQSTGGYTKIANVITVDMPKLAQAQPGTKVHFSAVGVEEAQDLIAEDEKKYTALKENLEREWTMSERYGTPVYPEHRDVMRNLYNYEN